MAMANCCIFVPSQWVIIQWMMNVHHLVMILCLHATLCHLFRLASLRSMKWITIHLTLIYHFRPSKNLRICVILNSLRSSPMGSVSTWLPTKAIYWKASLRQTKLIHDGKWDGPSRLFSALPFIWHKRQNGHTHAPCCWYIHFNNYCFPRGRIQVTHCLCWMSWVDNSQDEWQSDPPILKAARSTCQACSKRTNWDIDLEFQCHGWWVVQDTWWSANAVSLYWNICHLFFGKGKFQVKAPFTSSRVSNWADYGEIFLLIGSLTTRVTYCFGWNKYSILVNSEMITFCFAIMFSCCFMTKAICIWPQSSSWSFLTVCGCDEVNHQAASKEHKCIYGEAVKKMIGSFLEQPRHMKCCWCTETYCLLMRKPVTSAVLAWQKMSTTFSPQALKREKRIHLKHSKEKKVGI